MTECAEQLKNIVFWSKNKPVDDWTLTASSEGASNPVSNLKNTAPTITWKSVAPATSHWIEGSKVGDEQQMDGRSGVVLVNYVEPANAPSDVVNLKMYDATVGGNLVYDQSFPLSNYSSLSFDQGALIDEIRPYPRRVYYIDPSLLTGTVMRRWRLTFFYSFSQFAELGYAFVTQAFQPAIGVDNGAAWSAIDNTQIKEPWGGNQFTNARPFKNGMEITPNKTAVKGATDIYEWMRLISVNGKRKPIFVDPYPKYPDAQFASDDSEEAAFNLFNQMYGTLESSVRISRDTSSVMRMTGRLKVDESL